MILTPQPKALSQADKDLRDIISEYYTDLLTEMNKLPASREKALAVTNLEQSMLWVCRCFND